MSDFDDWWEKHYSMANLARSAAEDAWNAAVAHERERCAKIAESSVITAFFDGTDQDGAKRVQRATRKLADHIAATIRSSDK